MVRGSNPGGGEIFRTRPDRPWGPPSFLYNGYRDFSRSKAAGALCWPPTVIWVPRSWKGRAIPLLTLWAFVACYREKLYFTFMKKIENTGVAVGFFYAFIQSCHNAANFMYCLYIQTGVFDGRMQHVECLRTQSVLRSRIRYRTTLVWPQKNREFYVLGQANSTCTVGDVFETKLLYLLLNVQHLCYISNWVLGSGLGSLTFPSFLFCTSTQPLKRHTCWYCLK